jgi:hypothetical protein
MEVGPDQIRTIFLITTAILIIMLVKAHGTVVAAPAVRAGNPVLQGPRFGVQLRVVAQVEAVAVADATSLDVTPAAAMAVMPVTAVTVPAHRPTRLHQDPVYPVCLHIIFLSPEPQDIVVMAGEAGAQEAPVHRAPVAPVVVAVASPLEVVVGQAAQVAQADMEVVALLLYMYGAEQEL